MTNLRAIVESSPSRLAMPIGAYAGLALTGGTVRDVLTNPATQAAAVLALNERLGTPFLLEGQEVFSNVSVTVTPGISTAKSVARL